MKQHLALSGKVSGKPPRREALPAEPLPRFRHAYLTRHGSFTLRTRNRLWAPMMKLNDEVYIKWEALPWILAYYFAYLLIKGVVTDLLRPPAATADTVLFWAGAGLACTFLLHAWQMPRAKEKPFRYRELSPEEIEEDWLDLEEKRRRDDEDDHRSIF